MIWKVISSYLKSSSSYSCIQPNCLCYVVVYNELVLNVHRSYIIPNDTIIYGNFTKYICSIQLYNFISLSIVSTSSIYIHVYFMYHKVGTHRVYFIFVIYSLIVNIIWCLLHIHAYILIHVALMVVTTIVTILFVVSTHHFIFGILIS